MSIRLQISILIYMVVQAVLFGVGTVLVLATPLSAVAMNLRLFADFSGENGGRDPALIYFYQYVMWIFRGLKTCHDFGHEKTA